MRNFSISEALSFGFSTAKRNLGFFIAVLLISWLINYFPNLVLAPIISQFRQTIYSNYFLLAVMIIIIVTFAWVLRTIVDMGLLKIGLMFCDNQKPTISTLFSTANLLIRFILGGFLYGLIVFFGLLLLIIPGIIWAIKFQYLSYFIVDKGLGPIEALKQSSKITQGVKIKLILFGLAQIGVLVLGLLAFVVGLVVAIPTSMLASAYVFRKLSSQTAPSQTIQGPNS